jgi:hypothetical protein
MKETPRRMMDRLKNARKHDRRNSTERAAFIRGMRVSPILRGELRRLYTDK